MGCRSSHPATLGTGADVRDRSARHLLGDHHLVATTKRKLSVGTRGSIAIIFGCLVDDCVADPKGRRRNFILCAVSH